MPETEPFIIQALETDRKWNYFDVTNAGILSKTTHPEIDRLKFWDKIFDENKQQWNTTFDFHSV